MGSNVGSLFELLGLKETDYQKGLAKAEKAEAKATKLISTELDSLGLKWDGLGSKMLKGGAIVAGLGLIERNVS